MRHSPGQVRLWACLKKKKSYFTLRLCKSQIYSSDVYYFINIYTQMCTCIYSMQHFSSVTEPTHLTTGHLGTPLNITSMLEENTAIQAGSEQASWAWQCINAFFKALTSDVSLGLSPWQVFAVPLKKAWLFVGGMCCSAAAEALCISAYCSSWWHKHTNTVSGAAQTRTCSY